MLSSEGELEELPSDELSDEDELDDALEDEELLELELELEPELDELPLDLDEWLLSDDEPDDPEAEDPCELWLERDALLLPEEDDRSGTPRDSCVADAESEPDWLRAGEPPTVADCDVGAWALPRIASAEPEPSLGTASGPAPRGV